MCVYISPRATDDDCCIGHMCSLKGVRAIFPKLVVSHWSPQLRRDSNAWSDVQLIPGDRTRWCRQAGASARRYSAFAHAMSVMSEVSHVGGRLHLIRHPIALLPITGQPESSLGGIIVREPLMCDCILRLLHPSRAWNARKCAILAIMAVADSPFCDLYLRVTRDPENC